MKLNHLPTGECGDRTEPGIFYDGDDLAWRNGVLPTLAFGLLLELLGSWWVTRAVRYGKF